MHNLGLIFENIVDQYGDLNSIVFSASEKITYKELDCLSNQSKNALYKIGLKNDDVVLISGDKSLDMFVIIIASIKAGITYSVYDPSTPATRLRLIAEACEPKLIINSSSDIFVNNGELNNFSLLSYDSFRAQSSVLSFKRDNRVSDVIGNQLAYIMFTSGSTGTPKGVMISHDNVRSLLNWSLDSFKFGPGEILANVNPSYFDNFVFDFYSSLFSGASIVPFNSDDLSNPFKLLQVIDDLKCTSWFSVPTMLMYLQSMKLLTSNSMKSIRRIIFGGEGYPKAKLVEVFNMLNKRVDFYNVYGPTEGTCICSCYKVSQSDFNNLDGFLPLGALNTNFKYYILDDQLNPVNEGDYGELCILGPGIGQGYCNDIVQTESMFIEDKFCSSYRRTIYRTGDIVKLNSIDKMLYISGRIDNQIKHMGYRIELEEIENCVSKLRYVNQACCSHSIMNNLSIITLYVSISDDKQIKEIRDDIKQLVPKYMIPSRINILDQLPVNANGKIDRNELSKGLY